MRLPVAALVFWVLAFQISWALDRQAFTFTDYRLDVRIETEQCRLGVRGKVTLRNDSAAPQKNLGLQISSSLDWRSIQIGGSPADFTTHVYTSDIDHTGALSEAIVILPREIPPKGTVEVTIGYEGVIPVDATRLTRTGVPEEKARHADWDQIGKTFAGLRGLGFVTWYPVATEPASLSEEGSVAEVLDQWEAREAQAKLNVNLSLDRNHGENPETVLCSGQGGPTEQTGKTQQINVSCSFPVAGPSPPTLVAAEYQRLAPNDTLTVEYLAGQEESAKDYAEVAAQIDPIGSVGQGTGKLQILSLPDAGASPFMTEGILFTPLNSPMTNEAELGMVYAKARQLVISERPWIREGLAHYAQATFVERQKGRQAALDYLQAHAAALVAEETAPGETGAATHSLINAPNDLYLQSKAMFVWWMLKDMLGNSPESALVDYRMNEDRDAAYVQRLIEGRVRDLTWFFDDWVYRDRGLPDFRIASVYPRPMVNGGYMVTVEVENLGSAGAVVPVTLRLQDGEVTKRLEVRGKTKASIRIETATLPQEAMVNDGSVPESDMTNNEYKVKAGTR